MQLDEFPELSDEEWAAATGEPKKYDILSMYSAEGREWAMKQQPQARTTPRMMRGELRIIEKNIDAFLGTLPDNRLKSMSEGNYSKDLWVTIPLKHTTYMSDLNNYWHWYNNVRPGRESWVLSEVLDARGLYPIYRAIVREREAFRRKARLRKNV
jgi:hypothetical protein